MSKQTKQALVPKLRFPKFREAGEWKENTLEKIAIFSKGKGISKSDISPNGALPCIRYGELYTYYGETIESVISFTDVPSEDLVLSKANDVIIPASGETQEDIATASCVLNSGIALGGDLNIIRTKINGIFLSYYLNNAKKKDIAQLAQGISVVHLYSSQLKQLNVNIPKPPEQQKISDCLSSIDELITAQSQKVEAIKTHKKGLMQQLFPCQGETVPKLRFPEFREAGEWEEIPLKKLASRCIEKNRNGKVTRVLTNSAERGVIDQRDYFDKDIAIQGNLEGYFIVGKGDYVYNPRISAMAPVGPISRNNIATGVMSPLYTVFRFKKKDSDFYAHYFKTAGWHEYMRSVSSTGARHDRMAISKDDFMNMPLPVAPMDEEQQKISDCLSSIDELITAQAQKVEVIKTHKKGLMQQLFPSVDEEGT